MAYRRDDFPVADKYAYFMHSGVSALPKPTREAIGRLTDDMMRNGCLNESDWLDEIRTTRTLAAETVGVPADRIGFVTSTSHGLSWVAESLSLSEGDAVLVPDVEFPANRFPWENLERRGVEFRTLETDNGAFYEADVREALDEDVAVLAVSSVQFTTGFRCDLDTLGSLCRDENVYFVVDGIQSAGWDDLDLYSLPVDAFVADAHKWMCGPEGVGLIYLDRTFQQELEPALVGWQSVEDAWDFENPEFDLKDDASVIEMGSFNTIGLLAMGESLRLLNDVGLATIRDHNLTLKEELTEGLEALSCRCAHTSWSQVHQSPIVSFYHRDLTTRGLVAEARENDIQMSVRGGRPRVALHLYNNRSDIERFLDFIRERVSG